MTPLDIWLVFFILTTIVSTTLWLRSSSNLKKNNSTHARELEKHNIIDED